MKEEPDKVLKKPQGKSVRLLFFSKETEARLNKIIYMMKIVTPRIWYRSDGEIEVLFSERDFRNKVAPRLSAEELLNMKLERC